MINITQQLPDILQRTWPSLHHIKHLYWSQWELDHSPIFIHVLSQIMCDNWIMQVWTRGRQSGGQHVEMWEEQKSLVKDRLNTSESLQSVRFIKTKIKKGFALFLASKTDKMFDRQIYFFSLNFWIRLLILQRSRRHTYYHNGGKKTLTPTILSGVALRCWACQKTESTAKSIPCYSFSSEAFSRRQSHRTKQQSKLITRYI